MLLKNEVNAPRGTQRLVNGPRGVVIAWDWGLPHRDSSAQLSGAALPGSRRATSDRREEATCNIVLQDACWCALPTCAKCQSRRTARRRGECDYDEEPAQPLPDDEPVSIVVMCLFFACACLRPSPRPRLRLV